MIVVEAIHRPAKSAADPDDIFEGRVTVNGVVSYRTLRCGLGRAMADAITWIDATEMDSRKRVVFARSVWLA